MPFPEKLLKAASFPKFDNSPQRKDPNLCQDILATDEQENLQQKETFSSDSNVSMYSKNWADGRAEKTLASLDFLKLP